MKTLILALLIAVPSLSHAADMNEVACGWQHDDILANGQIVGHAVDPVFVPNGLNVGVSIQEGVVSVVNLMDFQQPNLLAYSMCGATEVVDGKTCFMHEAQMDESEFYVYVDNSLVQGSGFGNVTIQGQAGTPPVSTQIDYYSCHKE